MFLSQVSARPLVIVAGAFVLLAILLATAPQNALGFWPGVLAGVIACTLWRSFRTPPTHEQTRRRLQLASVGLAVGLALVLIPQRDIPLGAPFGLLVAWAGALIFGSTGAPPTAIIEECAPDDRASNRT